MRLIRDLLLEWAERERNKECVKAQRRLSEKKEAEEFLIELVTEGRCPYSKSAPISKWCYCSKCPIGNLNNGLSYAAAKRLCSKTRIYPK